MSLTEANFWTDDRGYGQDPLSILDTSKRIRQILDQELCNEPNVECESDHRRFHENRTVILHYYGKRPFKCKFPRCEFWRQGFEERTRRRQHERTHEKPLKCFVPGCKFERVGFLSEKMRQKHIQDGHSSDHPQPKFDSLDLKDDSIEPLLHYLVTENRVEEVRSVLSTLPNPETYKTEKLRMLASFSASPSMLQLLGEHGYESRPIELLERIRYDQKVVQCINQSIQGRNEMTMAYNLTVMPYPLHSGWRHETYNPFYQFISNGWLEGLKLWCKASIQQLETGKSRSGKEKRSMVIKRHLSYSGILDAAAKYDAGEEAVLFLWKESGLLSYISDISDWASRTLRHVARLGFSVTLATELLSKGANVNFQPRKDEKTALHCAARNDSVEGAEIIQFLLLKGADPEATVKLNLDNGFYFNMTLSSNIKRIGDEKGAQNIHKWLGKSWDELVEETKRIRTEQQVTESLESKKTEKAL